MYAKSKINTKIEESFGKILALQSNHLQSFIHKDPIRKFDWDPSNIKWTKIFKII